VVSPRARRGSSSGRYIGRQLTLELGDLVFQIQLALLEPLELQLILNSTLGKAGNDVIEVSVLEMQLVDALPEHLTVGRSYHGQHLHTDLTKVSIDPKKTKNEALTGAFRRPAAGPH
jgi:hypothetical protein